MQRNSTVLYLILPGVGHLDILSLYYTGKIINYYDHSDAMPGESLSGCAFACRRHNDPCAPQPHPSILLSKEVHLLITQWLCSHWRISSRECSQWEDLWRWPCWLPATEGCPSNLCIWHAAPLGACARVHKCVCGSGVSSGRMHTCILFFVSF